MSQTTQGMPAIASTILSQLNDKLDELRDLWGDVTDNVDRVEAAYTEELEKLEAKIEPLKDKLSNAEERCVRLEDAPWALDVSNDGTFILTHGDVECPQHVIKELLIVPSVQITAARLAPVAYAWME